MGCPGEFTATEEEQHGLKRLHPVVNAEASLPGRGARVGLGMAEVDRLRLLLIDDHPQDRSLASLVLARDLPQIRIREIEDAEQFASALRQGAFDVVVTDCQLSWGDGIGVLRSVREAQPLVPTVAFTDLRDESRVVAAMKAGFADYLFKGSQGYLDLPGAVMSAWEKASNQRLAARSEPWLQTVLDRSEIGVYRTTLDGRLVEATPAVLRLLGVTSLEEALTISLPKPYFLGEDADGLRRRLRSDRTLGSRQVEVCRADGSTVRLDLTEMLLLDVDDEMVIDVLVQEAPSIQSWGDALAARVDELERSNAHLSQFAYMASHELQEPLRMVEKFGTILAEDHGKELGSDGNELLQSVIDGAHRMQNVVDDLLALARIDSEGRAFEVVDSNEIVDKALETLEEVIRENEAWVDRHDLPTVRGDATQLVQLWQNLISNAIKFRREEAPIIRIAAGETPQSRVFSIADNGIGIEPEELENVFIIFRRLHPELPGTGIGLTLCQRIVERHGGRIWAETGDGEGSRFCFTLPKEPATPASEPDET